MALSRPLSAVLILLSSIILLSLRPIGNKTLHRHEAASGSQPFQDVDLALNITSEGTRTVALLFGQHDQPLKFTTEHRHVKRAINYQEAVCKGGELWDMIQEAFEGRRPPGPNFGPNELSNGWTESPMSGGLGGLPPGWDPAFAAFSGGGGRAPSESQIKNLLTSQDKPFRNAQGTQVQTPTGARYHQYYVPSHNAILAKYVESPKYLLGKRNVPAANIPSLVPPLNRLSDMSWYTYSKYAPNPAGLRYIGHHFISNPESSDIIDQILKATYNTNTPNIAWPGLQASINTDPGKALLATPNGVGIAWLLMDHAGVLGRRLPVARVWNANGFRCMLWDLVPQ
ncbi:MAG: hypothetical protein Q9204_005129 [Flavoplaca sp. TL-2023a]